MRIDEARRDATYAEACGKGIKAVTELRDATKARLARAVKQAGKDFAFDAVTEFSGTAVEKREHMVDCHSDLAAYQAIVRELKADAADARAIEEANGGGGTPPDPIVGDLGDGTQIQVAPDLFANPGAYATMTEADVRALREVQAAYLVHKLFEGLGISDAAPGEMKARIADVKNRAVTLPDFAYSDLSPSAATFRRDAGWQPEVTRSGRVELAPVYRRARIVNYIPSIPVTTSGYKYVRTTRRSLGRDADAIDNRAGATRLSRQENTAVRESAFRFGDHSETVQSLATLVRLTLEQMEDVPGAQAYVRMELFEALMMELDYQLFAGNGTAPNVSGFLDRIGTGPWDIPQTQVANSVVSRTSTGGGVVEDNAIQAMMTTYATLSIACDEVMFDGDADCDMCLVHQRIWSNLRTAINKEGNFIFGPPSVAAPMAVWGIPLMMHQHFPALANNSVWGLVGQFGRHCAHLDRKGITLAFSDSDDDDFQNLRVALRVDRRSGLAVFRGLAYKALQAGATF